MHNKNTIGLGPPRTSVPTYSYYNISKITTNSRSIINLIHHKTREPKLDSLVFAFYILHCAFNSALCILHSALINTFRRLRS